MRVQVRGPSNTFDMIMQFQTPTDVGLPGFSLTINKPARGSTRVCITLTGLFYNDTAIKDMEKYYEADIEARQIVFTRQNLQDGLDDLRASPVQVIEMERAAVFWIDQDVWGFYDLDDFQFSICVGDTAQPVDPPPRYDLLAPFFVQPLQLVRQLENVGRAAEEIMWMFQPFNIDSRSDASDAWSQSEPNPKRLKK